MTTKWIGASSNNYTVGRGGKEIKLIALHWIVGTLESADATFANPDRKASAHYGIGDNEIHQWVKEEDTAWHAGNWTVNQTSIGIEHEGGWLLPDGTRKVPTEATHQTSAKLVADICSRYGIPIDKEHIRTHQEYSATQCPGSLDVDRIIELARAISAPEPQPEVITDPKTKIDMEGEWGIMELQAVRSTVNDQKRALENCENAKNTEISEINEKWRSKLLSANTKLAECMLNKADEMGWRELFSIAWKKWWIFKKGGDNA
jgi:N-acetylmuramoyl-L-alanine amidase CwlA